MAEPLDSGFRVMLQAAVQSVQWTYSIFWKFCHQQGNLIWGDGYYNGAIKTRKTVQPMEVSAEEASLQRSHQLKELYESLSAGETNQLIKRPCAALSPEDLTESEWFYLMCVSFSFPPGTGLPGKAYAMKQHVWLAGANEVDSKTFSRAILAKSAHVQTVVCIPLLDGVVEVGTIDRVDEDLAFIRHITSFFTDHSPPQQKPALSEHSTSNPTTSSSDPSRLHSLRISTFYERAESPVGKHTRHQSIEEDDENDEEDDEIQSDSEAQTGNAACAENPNSTSIINAEASELMHLEMSDQDIRLGSPEDGSSHLDSDFYLQEVKATLNNVAAHQRTESTQWASGQLEPEQLDNIVGSGLRPPSTVAMPPSSSTLEEILTRDGTHYSQTVASILRNQSSRWVHSSSSGAATSSIESSFTNWTPNKEPPLRGASVKGTSQWLLKNILFSVPLLHTKHSDDNSFESRDGSESTTRLRKVTPQDELSANHVLAERRRREKLNERFILLRSLVPFVTKMDKVSILGDTIEYLKQLRRRIEELEALRQQMEIDQGFRAREPHKNMSNSKERSGINVSERARNLPSASDKRKMRIVEEIGGTAPTKSRAIDVSSRSLDEEKGTLVQVSIIESDALLELQCQHRQGVLLDVMQILRELQIEVTSVQSSVNNGILVAELRAKVKDLAIGKKASIVEVRKAVNQIIPHND